jgi:LmbE family N-acetylglucosaminyl deacetylase
MSVSMMTETIEQGVPLVVLSPHLDDAVLSCGALLSYACSRTQVTVVTLFTAAGSPPYTLSARRYLRQVGTADAEELYQYRREEDRAALEPMGVTCVHAGLPEALFRRRPHLGWRSMGSRLVPELAHIYPVYRVHITSGRIAPADVGTLGDARNIIERMTYPGPALVLAPLAIGGHVDHVLTRTVAERSDARIVYYGDFPYNQRHRPDHAFIRRNGLVEEQWSQLIEAKEDLIRAYRTQAHALFPDGDIPVVPEALFFPKDSDNHPRVPRGGATRDDDPYYADSDFSVGPAPLG